MKFIPEIILDENATISEAASFLEKNDFYGDGKTVLYVLNDDKQLLGSIMDSDLRRALIEKNLSSDTKVKEIMNLNPRKIIYGQTKQNNDFKTWKKSRHIPIVDENNILLGFKENYEVYFYPNKVVIMAGGLGKRLRPLTEHTPKPMLRIGSKPILQEIIESFQEQGFLDFYISINYKAQIIKEYFENGKKFNVKIQYLEEEKELGTCGSIKLAQRFLQHPFFVINGDVLANIDYNKMLQQHQKNKNDITLCAFPYAVDIPFGVIESNDKQCVSQIVEKPQYSYMINCGAYIINPEVITLIDDKSPMDMPTLIQKVLDKQGKVGFFTISEWIDIGNLEDFYRAKHKKHLKQGEQNEF
ncbi:nucleotidyltransferase family protein [Helicobacter enhydrae]|uniref:nucleotidyltransferase family protein n=1 Tax=Helicobacter enhydrae TaxID=222136 RepID=UPI000B24B299|nr:nucleotidyltransferase family protein [Helicobacter enhydrae]